MLFRTDGDGVIRNWPDRPKGLPPLMSNALAPVDAAHADYQGNIRFLLPARATAGQEEPVFANIPIDTFAMPMDAETRAGFSELVKGRYVLIGGDIIDNDQFNTPLSRFLDPITGQWIDTWDSTNQTGQLNRMPLQVKVTLVLKGIKDGPPLRFQTKFSILIRDPLTFGQPR